MGGYNYDLNDENLGLDENLLSDVSDTIATSPRLVDAPAAAPVPPASGVYDDENRKYWMNRLRHGAESANFATKTPEKVSTAPDWYKGGKPPGGNDWAKALIGMGSGMISGPAEVSMQNPLRPLGMKQQDAKQVAIGQGLGALLGGLVGKGKTQYDNELDAAKKQASMTHISAAGSSAGENEANLAARALALDTQNRGLTSLEQNRAHQQAEVDKLHAPHSPEAEAAKQLLISKGTATAEELKDATLATMQKQYPILKALEEEQGRAARLEAQATNERSNISARQNAQSENAAQAKKNEDTQNLARADLGHGLTWKGGIPPDEATQREARKQLGVRNYAFDALDRMTDIQSELNDMSHGFSGTFDEWMGTLVGTPQSQHAQDLITEAEQIQNNLKIQERLRANMGVPQEWEDRLVTGMNPRAGSLTGWLKGRSAWGSMKKELDKYTRASLDAHGVVPAGQAPTARPTYEQTNKPVAPIAKVRNKQVVQEAEIPAAGDTLPVTGSAPPIPATARASTPGEKRKYTITPKDGSKPFVRELTDAEYQAKLQAVGQKFDIKPQ